MVSTILSALGETVLHRNSLATVTDNWIVVREAGSRAQSLIAIGSVSCVRTTTTRHLVRLASAAGCLLIATATQYSKEASGAALPFALLGLALLTSSQIRRRASISFVVDSDVVQTAFGTLREAAALVATVQFVLESRRRGRKPEYSPFSQVRAYLALLL